MEIINPSKNSPKPIGAYSVAVRHAGIIYISGQVALDPQTGSLIKGDIKQQAKQVLDNLCSILSDSQTDFKNVLMTTIFLTSMDFFKEVGEVYSTYVDPCFLPARQTVAVKELPLGALVEISLIAKEP